MAIGETSCRQPDVVGQWAYATKQCWKTFTNHLVKLCAPRIEKRQERFEKLQSLAELRPIWNLKELSERLSTSRQTLYNWKEEGWLVVNSAGKADLKATVKLWKELQWHI